MIDGVTVRLRSWREEDLPRLTVLRNDVPLQAQLLCRVRGSNCDQTRDWLRRRSESADSLFWVVADRKTDGPLGYIQFIDMDLTDQRARMGVCLAPEAQGRGIGREVIQLALEHLRRAFSLRKVFLEVRADNERAIRCYERVGFKKCGVLHQHHSMDGRWYDVVLMELFTNQLGDSP